jgi:hypothetical protein
MTTLLADLNAAGAVSLATSLAASVAVLYFLLVDALTAVSVADFDPRPVVRRALESGRFDRLLIAVANLRYLARYRARHAKPSRLNALKGAER